MSLSTLDLKSIAQDLRYRCSYPGCEKSFINQTLLKRHLIVHTGEKPFECDVCGKRFNQMGNLTKHKHSHDTEHLKWDRSSALKPYKCTYPGCTKSFTAKASLKNHIFGTHLNQTDAVDTDSEQESRAPKEVKVEVVSFPASQLPQNNRLGEHLLLVAENHYLRGAVVEFAEYIAKWDSLCPSAKAAARKHSSAILEELVSLPALLSTDTSQSAEYSSANDNQSVGVALIGNYDSLEKEMLDEACCQADGYHDDGDDVHHRKDNPDSHACCKHPGEDTSKRQKVAETDPTKCQDHCLIKNGISSSELSI